MPGEYIEITIEILYIYLQMTDGLRPIHHNNNILFMATSSPIATAASAYAHAPLPDGHDEAAVRLQGSVFHHQAAPGIEHAIHIDAP